MLYRFKSQATADVIMLQRNGEQMLEIMGKPVGGPGVLTVEQIPAAIAALEAAVAAQEAALKANEAAAPPDDDDITLDGSARGDGVLLRQRAAPLIDMLRRSHEAGEPVVWGV